MRIATALQSALQVRRPGNNVAAPTGGRIAPTNWRSGRALLQRFDLRLISDLPVLIVHRRPDPVADQATDGGPGSRRRDPVGRGAANRRSDHCTRERTNDGASPLL